jgi:hypothetical protein
LDFIDNIKGFLLLILLSGKVKKKQANFVALIDFFNGYTTFVITAFFVLNSFLLTYRLLIQFEQSSTIKQDILILVKYGIRRLFRVYLLVLFIRLFIINKSVHFSSVLSDYFATFTDFFFVESIFYSYELFFEFFVPVFCTLGSKTGRTLAISLVSIFISRLLFYQYFENSKMKKDEWPSETNNNIFYWRFKTLLCASTAAFALCLCNRSMRIQRLLGKEYIRFILAIFSCSLVCYALRYESDAIILSVFVLLLMLSHPNLVTCLLEQANHFKTLGLYGFGVFFLHPTAVTLVHDYINPNKQSEHFSFVILFSFIQSFLFTILIQNQLVKVGDFLCSLLNSLVN